MPHTPRRYASTIGVPPELIHRPVQQHPPIPIMAPPPAAQQEQPSQRRLGIGSLNLRTYEPDYEQVYRTLFGKEPKIDPYTRQLVYPAPAAAPAAPLGAQQARPADAK